MLQSQYFLPACRGSDQVPNIKVVSRDCAGRMFLKLSIYQVQMSHNHGYWVRIALSERPRCKSKISLLSTSDLLEFHDQDNVAVTNFNNPKLQPVCWHACLFWRISLSHASWHLLCHLLSCSSCLYSNFLFKISVTLVWNPDTLWFDCFFHKLSYCVMPFVHECELTSLIVNLLVNVGSFLLADVFIPLWVVMSKSACTHFQAVIFEPWHSLICMPPI